MIGLKKTGLGIALVLGIVANTAKAAEAPVTSPPRDGFYAGVSLMNVDSTTKANGSNIDDLGDPLVDLKTYTQKLGQSTMGVGAHVGYTYFLTDRFFTGLDFGAQFVNGVTSKQSDGLANGTSIKNKLARKFSVPLSLKLGALITDKLSLYAKVGPTIGWFKLTSTMIDDYLNGSSSKYRSLWGLRPALGMQYEFSDKCNLHLEVAKETYYNRVRKEYNFTLPSLTVYTNKVSVKPAYTVVVLGVSYKI